MDEITDKAMDEMTDKILNAKVVFGLEAQGHIEKIDAMLADGRNWKVISAAIGWEEVTARKHYERFAQRRKGVEGDEADIRILLAEAVGFLKRYVKFATVFDSNDIHGLVFRAEKHLLSTPNKEARNARVNDKLKVILESDISKNWQEHKKTCQVCQKALHGRFVQGVTSRMMAERCCPEGKVLYSASLDQTENIED